MLGQSWGLQSSSRHFSAKSHRPGASPTPTAAMAEQRGEVLPNSPLPQALLPTVSVNSNMAGASLEAHNSQSLLDLGRVCHQPVAHCRELCLVSCLVVYCSASQLEFCVLTPPNHSKRFAHVLAMTSPCFPSSKKANAGKPHLSVCQIITHPELAFTLR